MLTPAQLAHLKIAAEEAVSCERVTALPAELTGAQWAVESGWGTHQPGNNCFGIKKYPDCYGVQMLETTEVVGGVRHSVKLEFATFPSLAACFEKHSELICHAKPYASAWTEYTKVKNVAELIKAVATVYATEVEYAGRLIVVSSMSAVTTTINGLRAA